MTDFRYDLHVHTQETSKCGWISAADMVKKYRELGYNGIAITDHLHDTYISSLPCSGSWDACVDAYLAGYRLARESARDLDFDVILGLELRFDVNDNDYLIYGVDEAFLRNNPYPYRDTICGFYQKFGGQVLILQAHPYRGGVDLQPQCLHGVEVVNCNQRHDSNNEMAFKLAEQHTSYIRISASDAHRPEDIGQAAMLFDRRIKDSFGLKRSLESGAYRMECPQFSALIGKYA